MKVKRLELKGFRGFDEIVLDFDTTPQRPTVFIGNNGVGKSSILDALAIFLSWFINRVRYDSTSEKPIKSLHHIMPENQLANGQYFDENDIKKGFNLVFGTITIDHKFGDYTEIKWSLPESLYNPNFFSLDLLTQLSTKIHEAKKQNFDESLPIITYYSGSRSVDKFRLESQDIFVTETIDAYKDALAERPINFKSFFQWFRNIEDLENENIRDDPNHEDKQLIAVRKAIHALIPEFDNLRVRRNPLRMTVNKTIGDKVEELIINQLSDGEKCLLAMVGDIARRLAIANPSLDDPLQGEGIVLIDEIELHLHPQWQHKIIPRLTETFPNCQFIVTTHSPQVLSHVQPENIYILQSTPDGIIASHPESSYGRDSNQILENVMGVSAYPEDIEKDLSELFRLIDRNDLVGAKQLREQLASRMPGPSDPQLIKAGVIIKGKEILGK